MQGFETTTTSLGGIAAFSAAPPKPKNIEEAAQAFEQVFIAQMLSHMFSGIKSDGPFSGGFSEDLYRGLLTEEYGSIIARQGGLGFSDALKQQMLAMQEVQS